ncbi:hypothetical protein GI374_12100 [Paracoccus sp. S-4012]|uniref:hypothetical protein n=1 Tax=Paracoccus sp. S-4012 TaxID=2665648 RepID=UPI0012B01015|nr:hypothetical protein [Paracoccus sp. S-4012]MRX51177.1 hypothetical protein [Paracoccus sp. S-4012]
MATLLLRLDASLDGASFDAALSGEVGRLADIARMAAQLRDNPAGVADFAAALAGLVVPALGDGAGVTAALGQARAAIPAVTAGAAPAALEELARFGMLVADRLGPILGRTVEAARAIEAVSRASFRCPPEPPPPGLPTPPPAPAPASGAGRAAEAEARAAEISTRLDQLPDPLTPAALIDFLAGLAAGGGRAEFFPMPLPVIDDVLQPLGTLAGWSLATPAEVGAEVEATLTRLRDRLAAASTARLDAATAAAAALQAPLRRAELEGFATAWITAAQAMAAALDGGDAAAAAARAAEIETALDGFDALRLAQAADFTPAATVAAMRLRTVPLEVHEHLLHLAIQLEPVDLGALMAGLPRPERADAAAQAALREALAPITDFFESLAQTLDLSVIEGEVATIAAEAQEIAETITGTLASVAQETRAAFAEVGAAVAAVPLDDLAAEVREGIGAAGDQLERAIRDAFAPAREALAAAIGAIAQAVDALDPEAVGAALADAVAAVAGVLEDPEVLGALAEIRGAIDQAADAAGSLSFAPLTDEVIALIEAMTEGLRALGDTELNAAIQGVLATALSVLPPDLRPVTSPLIADLGIRIDQGPVVLLEAVRAKPQEALDRIRAFDPAALAGETLGQPFAGAVAAVEALRPSQLLAPLGAELARERGRLRATAAPSRVLAPVAEAFAGLMTEFEALSPGSVLAPIEAAIEAAVAAVVEASPVDEVLAEVERVFATVEGVLGAVQRIGGTLDKAATMLSALDQPDAAIDAWRDAALAKLEAAPNGAALDARLAEVRVAAEAARGAELLARFDAGLGGTRGDLDTLDAEGALAVMAATWQRLQGLARSLPVGAERVAVEASLARFDPLDPAQAGGLRAASLLRRAIVDARADLAAQGASFEATLHGPEGSLTILGSDAPLRGVVAAEIEGALAPVRFLIAQLGGAALPLAGVAGAFADLHTRLTGALGNILTGPASLQSIAEAVQAVVDALRHIDLGFLRESLDAVFAEVRGEIAALEPAPLLAALDREFGEVLDALDLDLLLPQDQIAGLEADAAALADSLRAFDPAALIGATVGPAFEARILPLIETLDITPVFDVLIEALRGLEVQLEAEMGRINTAYQQLLAARPPGISVSVGVSVG